MSKRDYYPTLEAKKDAFSRDPVEFQYSCIENAAQFRSWYEAMNVLMSKEKAYTAFFRGVNEARFKLYNSAQ